MTDKAFKHINGHGLAETNWQKIKEAIIIGVGVSLLTAMTIGAVTWATNDRGEIKKDVKMLIGGQKVQEHNAAIIARRVNDNTGLIYYHIDSKAPCPDPMVLEKYWMRKE
jgi:hypothetical protein